MENYNSWARKKRIKTNNIIYSYILHVTSYEQHMFCGVYVTYTFIIINICCKKERERTHSLRPSHIFSCSFSEISSYILVYLRITHLYTCLVPTYVSYRGARRYADAECLTQMLQWNRLQTNESWPWPSPNWRPRKQHTSTYAAKRDVPTRTIPIHTL